MGLAENIVKQFELLEKNLNGQKESLVHNTRKEAFTASRKFGIPGIRHEEWKYTNIKTQLPESLQINATGQFAIDKSKFNSFPGIEATKLVFINGNFNRELSTILEESGVVTGSLKEQFNSNKGEVEKYFGRLTKNYEEHFSSLNTAFATDGAFVHIRKGTEARQPVFILHLYNAPENFIQSRDLIIAEENSSAKIVIDFQNVGSACFYNHVSEIFAGQNASLDIAKLQTETSDTTGIHTLEAEVSRNGRFNCTTISFDGKLIRNNNNVRLAGENIEAHMNGLYYATGHSLIDNHILVDHIVPNCQSTQLYKGILDGEATGVFNGKILVKKDAQKTNSYQSSKAILLSDEASVNSKPQLEIFADDVKCSHGASIGQLDENEIFYLRARGIEERDAKSLLTYAFANQIVKKLEVEAVRNYVDDKLRSRLALEF